MNKETLKSLGRLAPLLGLLLFFTGQPAAAEDPIRVVVSILPQQWFAEQIGGPQARVSVLVGPGHSPATFEPTPRALASLQSADLFLSSGVPFERGLLPRIQGLQDPPRIRGPRPAATDHGHHHHEIDPHTWLDPQQALDMARLICAEFSTLRPDQAQLFTRRLNDLQVQLEKLDGEIQQLLSPHAGREFFVFHPAFGHFAAAYGLVQVAVEEHGHEPGPRQLAQVVNRAREAGARAIVVQPQFSQKSAETVARSAGLEVLVLDPLSPDYPTNLLHIARSLAGIFSPETEAGP